MDGSLITTAATGLETELAIGAAAGLAIGAGVFAVSKGWSLLRRFVG